MKLRPAFFSKSRVQSAWLRAFTLAEIMTATAIFSLVIIGALYSHIFGIKLANFTSTKLTASQNARKALGRVQDEIRSGKILYVGNGDFGSFTNTPANAQQKGNALQICPTANTNVYVRYYFDPNEQALKRKTSGSANVEVVANYVTNQVPFQVEDYAGNVLTNSQNNRVIKMTLEFYQWEFAAAQGPGAFYDYYRVQTKIVRRAIE